ncbi:DNA polymerase III subunit beta [Candidatus Uhrbacteria bacterium]|nr:DNA polymerase III subunit beta [Candidatus Uhrbacteria bacterium]
MKLSCTKENLHQGLSITSHLMTKNVNLPILQNVLIKAEGGTVRFTSTNLELAVHCTVRGKIEETGENTIPSKLFFDYVSLLPNETIHIETENDSMHIECGKYKTKINGLSASEFPLVPKVEGDNLFKIPVDEFKRGLLQVLFSVATNESRPELTGVLMQFFQFNGEGRLKMASTDSYRLSEKIIPVTSEITEEKQVVVPARTLSEVSRILSVFKDEVDLPSTISLQLAQNQALFVYGPVELISRVIDESYPDYEQIIPKQFQTKAILDREDFLKSVKAASLFSKNGLFDVTLQFDPQNSIVEAQATDSVRGQNSSSCEAELIGQKNTVTINYRYLLDGLQAMDSDRVNFEMIDASNPCLLSPEGKIEAYRYVLMPIKA